MAQIEVAKGLDIPIRGKPSGNVETLKKPQRVALNLEPFEETRFKLMHRAGSVVKKGEPLVHDKACEQRVFVSPGGGFVKEVRRGLKRRLIDIVIELSDVEEEVTHKAIDITSTSREQIIELLLKGGAFPHIRQRPFGILADPAIEPRSIFVKAVETAPFVPSAEMQVEGHEAAFQAGLDALRKLTSGEVHLVFQEGTPCKAFSEAKNVTHHTVSGPHPAGNHSVHIHNIAPITAVEDVVWTVTAYDVIVIGTLLTEGRYFTDRVISIGGPGLVEGRTGFFKGRAGHLVSELIINRVLEGPQRFISGDPLTGKKVENEDFLGFYHTALSVIPENVDRELLHFFRLGIHKYTFSRAYLSGFFDPASHEYDFSTNMHGEHRAFIDGSLYDKVMPMRIPTMTLVKAVMAGDYDLAEQLGLLEVIDEDFALATFVCPSKMEMSDIIKTGLHEYRTEVFG